MTSLAASLFGRCHAGSAPRRSYLVIALVCLLCAQALGFMHGVVHGFNADQGHRSEHVSAAGREASLASEAEAEAEGGLAALFADHDPGDCRLFDTHKSQGPAFAAPDLLGVLAPCLRVQRLLAGAFVARWAAFFDARGPPLSH